MNEFETIAEDYYNYLRKPIGPVNNREDINIMLKGPILRQIENGICLSTMAKLGEIVWMQEIVYE